MTTTTTTDTAVGQVEDSIAEVFSKIAFGDAKYKPLITDATFLGAMKIVMTDGIATAAIERAGVIGQMSLNQATNPYVIYNDAANAEVDLAMASPLVVTIVIKIPLQTFYNYQNYDNNGNLILELPRQTVFQVGLYRFLAPNNIMVSATPTKSGATIAHARSYYGTDYNLAAYDQTNAILRTTTTTDHVIIEIPKAYQLSRGSLWKMIVGTDTGLYWKKQALLSGYLAGFNATYTVNSTTYTISEKLFYNGKPSSEKYIRYLVTEADTGQAFTIMCNPSPEWRPPGGAELVIEYFTTEGALSFSYTGVVTVSPRDSEGGVLSGANITGELAVETVSGGSNFPTLTDLRAKVIQQRRFLKTVVTAGDIESAINTALDTATFKTMVYKHRDDCITRSYVAKVLFHDGEDCLPTNTIDIYTSYHEISGFGNCVPAAATVIYDAVQGYYRFLGSTEYDTDYTAKGILTYAIPCRMLVQTTPYFKMVPVFESTNIATTISDRQTQQFFAMIPQSVAVRQAGPHNQLMISFFLSVNVDTFGTATDGSPKSEHLLYRVFIKNDEGDVLAYADVSPEEADSVTRIALALTPTTEYSGSKLCYTCLTTSLKNPDGSVLVSGVYLPEGCYFQLTVFYDVNCSTDEDGSLSDWPEYLGYSDLMTSEQEYIPVASFTHADPIAVFRIVPALAPDIDLKSSGAIMLTGVPVIGIKAFSGASEQSNFGAKLAMCIETLDNLLTSIKSNFTLLLKFANSYGFTSASLWSCEHTQISLSLVIHSFTTISTDEQLQIRSRIKKIVSEANNPSKKYLAPEDFYVLKSEFPKIRFIEVLGMDNQWRSAISCASTDATNTKFEYLNTSDSNLKITWTQGN